MFSQTVKAFALTSFSLLALVATGGSASAALAPDSEKEFRDEAGEICNETVYARVALREDILNGKQRPTKKNVDKYVERYRPVLQEQIEDLADTDPPKKLQKGLAKLLKTMETELATLVDNPPSMLKKNPFSKSDKLAKALRLQNCAPSGRLYE